MLNGGTRGEARVGVVLRCCILGYCVKLIWDHVCVSVEDEEAASCNLHDFGYVASTAVSPIRQLGLGERETIFRLLYERNDAPTSIHAMRRIRTALTHTHGAGGTAFTQKKKHLEMASSASVPLPGSASGCQRRMGARGTGRPPAGWPGRLTRARRGVHGATSASRPGQVPRAGRAVARGRSRHARSAHGGAAGSHFQAPAQRFRRRRHSSVRSSVCESVTRSVYLGPASVLEQSSKLVVYFSSGTLK